jgi:uncharacterized protein YidB (DUF937 family)
MGLLDQVIGSALGGGRGAGMGGGGLGGGLGGGMGGGGTSPVMMALMALLSSGAMSGGRGGGLGGMLGGALGGQSGGMGGGLGGMGGGMGGLGGLLQQFQRNGHGDVMNSWIGTGPNRPIQPNQLSEALGPDTINDLSQRTGMPQQDLLAELSRHMPGVVDQLTPHGRLPDESEQAHW